MLKRRSLSRDAVCSPGRPLKEAGLACGAMGKNIENALCCDEMVKRRSLSRDSAADLIRCRLRLSERAVLDNFNTTRGRVSTAVRCFAEKGSTETEKCEGCQSSARQTTCIVLACGRPVCLCSRCAKLFGCLLASKVAKVVADANDKCRAKESVEQKGCGGAEPAARHILPACTRVSSDQTSLRPTYFDMPATHQQICSVPTPTRHQIRLAMLSQTGALNQAAYLPSAGRTERLLEAHNRVLASSHALRPCLELTIRPPDALRPCLDALRPCLELTIRPPKPSCQLVQQDVGIRPVVRDKEAPPLERDEGSLKDEFYVNKSIQLQPPVTAVIAETGLKGNGLRCDMPRIRTGGTKTRQGRRRSRSDTPDMMIDVRGTNAAQDAAASFEEGVPFVDEAKSSRRLRCQGERRSNSNQADQSGNGNDDMDVGGIVGLKGDCQEHRALSGNNLRQPSPTFQRHPRNRERERENVSQKDPSIKKDSAAVLRNPKLMQTLGVDADGTELMLRMNSLKEEITKHQMRRIKSLSLDSRGGVDNSRNSARKASTSFATKLHPLPAVASMHLTSRKKSRVDSSLLGSSPAALVWDLEETLKNNQFHRSATSLGFTRT